MAFPRTGGQFPPTASLVPQMVESACNAGDLGSIPQLGRSPGEGNALTPIFLPRESKNRGTWQDTVCGRKESATTE